MSQSRKFAIRSTEASVWRCLRRPGLQQRFVHPRPCLIEVTLACQSRDQVGEHPSVGFDGQSPNSTICWISKVDPPLQDGTGDNELPKMEATIPLRVATYQLPYRIVPCFTNLFELIA